MENNITKSQIKNIGKRLRSSKPSEDLNQADLRKLNDWRSHHNPSLKYFANLIKAEALNLKIAEADFTITQRLKRIYSMILKLKRFQQMQLSTMDDIAGLRIVLPTTREVIQLTDVLKAKTSKHKMIKLNNYISHPKDDGYRSIHAIYKVEKSPIIQIELQLRSSLQHFWATGVEVFGTLEKTSFKTGDGAKEWQEFFKLLSSRFAIKENTTILKEHEIYTKDQLEMKLINQIRSLNIIEQLNAYTSAYSSDWRQNRPKGRAGKYALLILDTIASTTKVTTYSESKLDQALNDYSIIEKTHHSSNEINVVLVNLDNIDNLEKAYPNYFMDTKTLSKYLSQIVLREF